MSDTLPKIKDANIKENILAAEGEHTVLKGNTQLS